MGTGAERILSRKLLFCFNVIPISADLSDRVPNNLKGNKKFYLLQIHSKLDENTIYAEGRGPKSRKIYQTNSLEENLATV